MKENMDTSDTLWHWYYQADCGRWHRFEVNFYLIFFKSYLMLQTDLTTGKQRRIQTTLFDMQTFFSNLIFEWYINGSYAFLALYTAHTLNLCVFYVAQLIPLDRRTPEYQDVAHYATHNGLLNETIVSITRIQNLDLWEMYCRKKKQLMRLKGTNSIQERRLFHGTDSENIASICTNNFDLRLAGQHGKLYGKGIYFTTYAFFANAYSTTTRAPTNGKLTKVIFLARVMVGKSKPGEIYFCKPDHGSLENVHDSCVDDLDDPMIFIIFDPNQIYPEYLIEYEL
uniref:Poly [ADP-ribose] polymerase n=1 Tax=Poecilia reticulata TaxID=8081 RepID=A0A3P9N2W7_POERE